MIFVQNFWSNSHRIRPIKPLIIGVKINYTRSKLKSRFALTIYLSLNIALRAGKKTFKWWCLHLPERWKKNHSQNEWEIKNKNESQSMYQIRIQPKALRHSLWIRWWMQIKCNWLTFIQIRQNRFICSSSS